MKDESVDVHRRHLVEALERTYAAYDRTVMVLSGGALTLSLGFVDKIVATASVECQCMLIGAWIFWCLSLTAVLASHYLSTKALREAIVDCDKENQERAEKESVLGEGVKWQNRTTIANLVSGIAFVIGLVLVVVFVSMNIVKL